MSTNNGMVENQVADSRMANNDLAPRSRRSASAAAWSSLPRRIGRNLVAWIAVLGRAPRAPRARLPRWGALGFAIGVAVAAIVASMFFVDAATTDWARHLPRWLIAAADDITDFGLSSWFLYPLGFVVVYLAAVTTPALPPMLYGTLGVLAARFGFLFVAIGLPGLLVTIAKRIIGRARPYVGLHDDPFAYIAFAWRPDYASMPSGHAATVTTAAIAFGAIWPRLRPPMWLYAFVIMATRIIIGVHHPSDVIAGALVGIVGALLVRRWFAARRLVFSATDLRAFPGPSRRRLRAVAGYLFGRSGARAN
jgi:membrane-associated phospholipid phosphatase